MDDFNKGAEMIREQSKASGGPELYTHGQVIALGNLKAQPLRETIAEQKAEIESLKKALNSEGEDATLSGGVLSNVCDILFEDEERASAHGYDGVEDKARWIVENIDKLDRANDELLYKIDSLCQRESASHESAAERAADRILSYIDSWDPRPDDKERARASRKSGFVMYIMEELSQKRDEHPDHPDGANWTAAKPAEPSAYVPESHPDETQFTATKPFTIKVSLTPELEARLLMIERSLQNMRDIVQARTKMNRTSIPWTDFTWTVSRGCSPVSAGCANCYASRFATRFAGQGGLYEGLTKKGLWTGKVRLCPENIGQPLKRKKPAKIFVNSMSDLFHASVTFDYLDKVFGTIALCSRHTFQVLTKRPERAAQYFRRIGSIPENVWLGVSIENEDAMYRLDILRKIVTVDRILFVSLEPMLGPIDFDYRINCASWVILGEESGPGARLIRPYWARSVRDQCVKAGVPFFYKQGPDEDGKTVSMPELDGRVWNEFPSED